MRLLDILDINKISSAERGGVITLGKFDAVHLGHASLFARVAQQAAARGVRGMVVTFDPSPVTILSTLKTVENSSLGNLAAQRGGDMVEGEASYPTRFGYPPPALCTFARRIELLSQYNLDAIVVLPTTRELLQLTPDEFARSILHEQLGISAIVEGENFRFGAQQSGTIETLRTLGKTYQFEVESLPPVRVNDAEKTVVSASSIRSLISSGDVKRAQKMLGYDYRLTGTVVRGKQLGKTLGFPTANLENYSTLLPAEGVYATHVTHKNQQYAAATHIGRNLTFAAEQVTVESFLLDFSGDLYDTTIDLDFVDRIRDGRAFNSAEELAQQMKLDVASVRKICGK